MEPGWSFLFARARPYRGSIAAISALTLLGALGTLALPWLAGQLLGGVLDQSEWQVKQVAALLLGVLAGTTALNIASAMLSARISGHVLADLRRAVYDHVQALPLAFHDQQRQGDLLALMTYEVTNLGQFLTGTLAKAPSAVVTAAGAIALLFAIDPTLALFVPLLLPVFFLVLKLVGRHMRKLAMRAREAMAMAMSTAEEDLEMLFATKAFAVEEPRRARYAGMLEDVRRLELAQQRVNAVLAPAIALVAAIAAITLIMLVGLNEQGERDPGDLFAFLLYAALLTRPIGSLADFYGRYQWARGTLARLESVFGEPVEAGLAAGLPIKRAKGAIEFAQVHFDYPGRDGPLRGLNLAIAPGEIVALTGANGAGKSTLIHLLMRFYSPQRGAIRLDGTDIAEFRLQDLRRQFGLVPQREMLLNASLRENILFGASEATPQEVEAALDLAQARSFVAGLSEGLDTRIGDHGVMLSGGQRQRIALARALILDPPVLIFDEATAMWDYEGESAFVEASRTAFAGRTVIIVTHRPASLALADRVIAVEGGLAVEAVAGPES